MWLIGAMVCLLAAPWVQLSVSAGMHGWPHNALRLHWLMPISCHFRDCKALLVTSLTHVSGAIASVPTFTFTFTFEKGSTVLHIVLTPPRRLSAMRLADALVCFLSFSAIGLLLENGYIESIPL